MDPNNRAMILALLKQGIGNNIDSGGFRDPRSPVFPNSQDNPALSAASQIPNMMSPDVLDSYGYSVNSPASVAMRITNAQDPDVNEYGRQLNRSTRDYYNSMPIPSMNHNDMSNVPGPFIDPRNAIFGKQ